MNQRVCVGPTRLASRRLAVIPLIALCVIALDTVVANAQIPTDPVGIWNFDEDAGTAAIDTSGNESDATLSGPTRVDGIVNGALSFTNGDYASIASAPSTLKPSSAYAVSAWVKYTSTGTNGGEVASMGDSYSLRVTTTGAKTYFYDTGTQNWKTLTVTTTINNGAWHHIVGQYTGSALQIYVDGTLINSQAASGTISYNLGSDFVIGKHGQLNGNDNYIGSMDQVRVFGRALTQSEITSLARERAMPEATGEWLFDEGTGSTANDTSGGGNGATITSGTWTTGKVGNALTFTADTTYAQVSSPSTALKSSNAFAISAWVRASSTDSGGSEVLSMGDYYALRITSGGDVKTFFKYGTNSWHNLTSSGVSVLDSAWHHILGQYTGDDAASLEVWIDGVRRAQQTITSGTSIIYTGSGTSLYIGKHANGTTTLDYRGDMDQVRVYNHSLTSEEIAALAQEAVGANQRPEITALSASPNSGTSSITAQFALTVTDAENDPLTYEWDFDNDGVIDSTIEDPSHTYSVGKYTAVVTIRDSANNATRGTVPIVVNPSSAGSAKSVTLIDLNIGGGKYLYPDGSRKTCNLEDVAKYISDQKGDIALLNEVLVSGADNDACKAKYKVSGTYPRGTTEPQIIESFLEEMTGVSWTSYFRRSASETWPGGNMLIWKDSLPDSAPTLCAVSGGVDPDPCGDGGIWRYSNVATYGGSAVHLSLTINSQPIMFYSTHLTADTSGGSSRETQRADEVDEMTDDAAGRGDETLVIGDFNTKPGSTSYNLMAAEYDDAWVTTTASGSPGTHKSNRIDYVWLNKNSAHITMTSIERQNPTQTVTGSGGQILTVNVSDHYPLKFKFDVQ